MEDKTVVIVGMSKGFGRDILHQCLRCPLICSHRWRTNFILVTSNREAAMQVWESLYSQTGNIPGRTRSVEALIKEVNLTKSDSVKSFLHDEEVLQVLGLGIGTIYVFMVAGSVTPVGPLLALDGPDNFYDSIENHLYLNMVSFASILRTVINGVLRHPPIGKLKLNLVNVSSLAAIREFHGMAVYCAIKAARDSFMRSISLELEKDHPLVEARVLNYAPGMMETEMVTKDLLGSDVSNAVKCLPNPQFVSTSVSAKKCVDLITGVHNHTFANGEHIDFYDVYFI